MKASEAIWKLMNGEELKALRLFTQQPNGFLLTRHRAGQVLDRINDELAVLRIMIAQAEGIRDHVYSCMLKPNHKGDCRVPKRKTEKR